MIRQRPPISGRLKLVQRSLVLLAVCIALAGCKKIPAVPVPTGVGPDVPCGEIAFGGFPQYVSLTEKRETWPTYFLCRPGEYAMEFDPNIRLPRWTMSKVDASNWQGEPAKRRNDLRPDPLLPPDRRNTPEQWAGSDYGFFQLQPADMVDNDEVAISHTFYASTLLPVDKRLFPASQALNDAIRAWAATRGELVMVSGPIFNAGQPMGWLGTPTRSSTPTQSPRIRGLMAVPSYVFRVVLDPKTGQSTAFVLPNTALPPSELATRRVSLNQIEQWAGMTLFPRLDPASAAKIREPASQNPAYWPLPPSSR